MAINEAKRAYILINKTPPYYQSRTRDMGGVDPFLVAPYSLVYEYIWASKCSVPNLYFFLKI